MAEYTKRKLKAYKNFVSLDGDYNGIFCICQDYVESGSDVCAEANTQELVRRWNSHDSLKAKADSQPALLEACEAALAFLNTSSKLDWDNILTPQLKAAIEAGRE